MSENFTIQAGAYNTSYVDIPVYYWSNIDQKVEKNINSIVRPYSRDGIQQDVVLNFFERNSHFLMNFAAHRLELDENVKDRTIKTMPRKDILSILSNSSILSILSFYFEVRDSFIETNSYRKDIENAKLALTCFNLLAAYSKQFIHTMDIVAQSTEQEFNGEHIKILFRTNDPKLRNDFYVQWLSTLENSAITRLGLKIHEKLVSYYSLIKKHFEVYGDNYDYSNITTSDEITALNKESKDIIKAFVELLIAAEYTFYYVEVNSYVQLLDFSRKISTDLRVLEQALKLPSYATTDQSIFKANIHIEFVRTEKISKKKGSLGFNITVDANIGLNNAANLIIDIDNRHIIFDTTKLLETLSRLSLSDTFNAKTATDNIKTVCILCEKTLSSIALNVAYSKAIYATLVAVSLIRYIVDIQNNGQDLSNIADLYNTLWSILIYAEQSEDTTYVTRATNGMIEEYGDASVQYFMTSLVRDQFALAQIKALLDNTDNQKSANYLHNRFYNILKVTDAAFYQPYVATYDKITVKDVLNVAGTHDIISKNQDRLKQNLLSVFVADNLFWLDEYLGDLDCESDVFTAYELGMQTVYEKYPHMKRFFKTFYSFYIIGVVAYLLKDFNLPLQVLNDPDRFNIDTIAKKLRKDLVTKQQEKERTERQKELDRLAKEREEERKRQQELEAQRLAEQKAAEEQERRKQIDSEEANKIMEELNKNAWAGFTVPQQQAAYIRYLQEGNSPLVAANLVKDEFVRRQEEEEKLLAQWEQEAKEEERLKQLELEAEAERQRLAEEARKEEERKAHKALCDKADKQYEDMRAGRAIFINPLLSEEEQKTAPLLNIYEIAKLAQDMTTPAKLMQLVYDAPGDKLATDIVYAEITRLLEIKKNQIIDPIDKEVMVSARALANKHCVPYEMFAKLVELGMPIQQALIIPRERLDILARLYNADKIVHDRNGRYVVCKGEYILPVTFRELRELYAKYNKTKGGDKKHE